MPITTHPWNESQACWQGPQAQGRAASVVVRSAADSEVAGQTLARDLGAADLAFVLLLCDRLAMNGSQLLTGLIDRLGPGVQVAGGLAGDGTRFQTTLTALNAPAQRDQGVAIGFYGQALEVRSAAEGEWDSFGPSRTISSAQGATLLTLDGEPALDLHERYLGDEARDLPASALICPLCAWPVGRPEQAVVRTVFSVDRAYRAIYVADNPTLGFYSYGELAPHAGGGRCDLHNQTMTISLLGERAW